MKAALIIAVLASIAGHLPSSPNQGSSNHQKTIPQQGTPNTPMVTVVIQNPERSAPAETPKPKPPQGNATPEWALVFVGIVTFLVIGWQCIETHRAVTSQRDKDRARLSVAPSYREGFVNYDNPSLNIDNRLSELGVEITQHGPTKAFNVQGFALTIVDPNKDKPTIPKQKLLRMHTPSVIDASPAPVSVASIAVSRIDNTFLESVWNKQSFIHFWGVIVYDDVFGKSHKSRFRYVWNSQDRFPVPHKPGQFWVGDPGSWELAGKKKDNRET